MKKLPIILSLLLVIAWWYTSWYWYVCNIKDLCDMAPSKTNEVAKNENIIRYEDVFSQNPDDLEDETVEEKELDTPIDPLSTQADAPKLSSNDVLKQNPKPEPKAPETEKSVNQEASNENVEETEVSTATGEVLTQEKKQETSSIASICDEPLVGPIGLWASNNKAEVERLEAFLAARWENVILNGIYEQNEFEAVKNFQIEYRADILDPWDITQPTGYVFRTTVKKINEIACQ